MTVIVDLLKVFHGHRWNSNNLWFQVQFHISLTYTTASEDTDVAYNNYRHIRRGLL